MKKLLALFLSMVLVVSLAACAASPSSNADTTQATTTQAPESTETQAPESAEIKVDIFWYTFADTYLTSVRNSIEEQLVSIPNIKAQMIDCENDQAKQTERIQTSLTSGVNVLVVNIVNTDSQEAAQNIVDLAKDADVPIIFFNREVKDEVINSYDKACFVGTDADEAGYLEGEAIANFLLEGDNLTKYDLNGDGEISYIMLRGEEGNPEAYGRTKYSVTKANEMLSGKAKLVPSKANATSTLYEDDGISNYYLYGNWSAETAAALMRTALSTYKLDNGDIELIIANNDDQAIGAIEAMNELGYNTGSDPNKYIPIFGVDATDVAQQAIKDGKMTGTVLQDGPAMGACILSLANNVANGEDVFANTGSYNVDSAANKIRIAYQIVK